MTFFEKFLRHEVKAKDIHKYIEKWHRADTAKSLHEYLGMSQEQYGIFIRYPEKVHDLKNQNMPSP